VDSHAAEEGGNWALDFAMCNQNAEKLNKTGNRSPQVLRAIGESDAMIEGYHGLAWGFWHSLHFTLSVASILLKNDIDNIMTCSYVSSLIFAGT
jgi:hypothetical protein